MTVCYDRLDKCGRLGNSLFELAATLGVADRRRDTALFNGDWLHRPFFSVPDSLFGDCSTGTPLEQMPDLIHIDPRARTYAQDVNLFTHIMPKIREYLRPSDLARGILAEHSARFDALRRPILGVHVRRGDNIVDPGVPNKAEYHFTPPLPWYQQAISTALADREWGSIAVITDDPKWCLRNLPADYVHKGISRPKEQDADYLTAPVMDWIDLLLLARCDLLVISGSTFGIWGALLSDAQVVVRPDKVYGPRLDYIDSELLFLPEWQRLEVDSC